MTSSRTPPTPSVAVTNVPDGAGKFTLEEKHQLEKVDVAETVAPKPCFIVIDELSRCDPSRVFGEVLTYIEMTKRDVDFSLP